jgi:hypothetical protein
MGSARELPLAELVRLYCEQGLSTTQIAALVGWSPSAVYARLVALGTAMRTPWAHNAVEIDSLMLRQPYVDEGLPMSALAERCGCSLTTIWRKLKAAGISARPDGGTPHYPRQDFSGDLAEMAYLIGFRLGDLNIEVEGKTICRQMHEHAD